MKAKTIGATASLWTGLIGCGGHSPPPVEHAEPVPAPVATAAQVEEPKERSVSVAGIEGTLAAIHVQNTMEKQLDRLAQCQADSLSRVPHLAGEVAFRIRVKQDGSVRDVALDRSSIGDRDTEVCVLDVVRGARFPRPNGGEATVRWSMAFDVQGGRGPDAWDPRRVRRQVERRDRQLRKACALGDARVAVTAYVGRSGRVLAAGAVAKEAASEEALDCVAEDVKSWKMPRGKRVAKVTFEL